MSGPALRQNARYDMAMLCRHEDFIQILFSPSPSSQYVGHYFSRRCAPQKKAGGCAAKARERVSLLIQKNEVEHSSMNKASLPRFEQKRKNCY